MKRTSQPPFIFAIKPLTLLVMTALLFAASGARAEFSSLNLGMDYRLKGNAVQNNDMNDQTKDNFNYYSQDVRLYMTSWLNEDVEGSVRLQSINIWGQEGTSTITTRYPFSDGSPWVEQAYIHLPHIAWNKVNLTIGRQPIVIGDGMLVSDDNLGFNAIRAQVDLPWEFDADVFTAKISENLNGKNDTDLNGLVFGTTRKHNRWEFSWIQERNDAPSAYLLAASTMAVTKSLRQFYDVRLYGSLKDAYYKLEYAMQGGNVTPGGAASDIKLKGSGEKIELGAQADTARYGRFGVRALYAAGSGDDAGTGGTDEAFRPTFARRWDGLQRAGYGQHFAATLSDAYSSQNPFSSSPNETGLPAGFSGIKTLGFGIWSTQNVSWTGGLDYYIFNAVTKPTGKSDLGAELDGTLTYRYTGFVTFNFGAALFFPGDAFGPTASRVTRYTASTHIHF